MIAVSDKWKEAHEELLLPETFIKLSYGVTEPGLSDDATATGVDEESFAETEEITNTLAKNPELYASMEKNAWGLDGTIFCLDDEPTDPGYITTTMSDENAEYGVVPTITVTFSKLHTELIPGITLTWSSAMGEWATDFRITAYNGSTQVAQKTVTENMDVVSKVWVDLQNYNKIVVEILGWCHPHRRCRVEELYLGIVEVYTKDNLLGYDHSESVDILSAALPKNEITFRLENSTGRWNPNNPTGAERYLLEQQKFDVQYGMRVGSSVEWIKGGTFWLSEWNTPSNGLEASFTARDAVTFMNGVYTGSRSGTLFDIAVAAFEQAELPIMSDGSPRFSVGEALTSQTTDFTEDEADYTIAEVLQMVAHMGCCVFYQDRDGRVHIEPRNVEQTDYVVNQFRAFAHPEFKMSKPLKAVSVDYAGNRTRVEGDSIVGEVQTVSNPLLKTEADARKVANAAITVLSGRKTLSGEYRADPRLCALDTVKVESKYDENTVVITDIKYSTTGGAMKGSYVGRVVG